MKTDREFTVDYFKSKYRGRLDNKSDWMIYCFGDADSSITSFVHEIVSFTKYNTARPFSCYDLGANRGDFSLKVAGMVDNVVAIEPCSSRYSHLKENISLSGAENIKTFNIRLNDDQKAPAWFTHGPMNRDAERLPCEGVDGDPTPLPTEPAASDVFVDAHDLQPPDLIRINAGHDYLSVICWLGPLLRRAQPIILIERSTLFETDDISESGLQSVLYEGAKLYSLSGSPYRREFKLDGFVSDSHRIVCYPQRIERMIEQNFCKMKGLRLI